MTTTLAPPETDEVAAAETERDRLRERMAAGEAVSTPQWEKAEAGVRFALARRDAAERGERDRAERSRQAKVAALAEAIPVDLDPSPIAAARADLAAALDRFVGFCRAYDRRFADAVEALSDPALAPLPPGLGAEGVNVRIVNAGGRTYRAAPTQRTIAETATEAIAARYGPRQSVDLGRPRD